MSRRFSRGGVYLLFAFFLLLLQVEAGLAHGGEKKDKPGILLVAFGTSVPEAEGAMRNIEAKAREAFPDVEIRWAYTSKIIRHKLVRENRPRVDSPAEALARMMDEGFTRVAVQSLHIIPGEEYEGLVKTAQAFSGLPKGMERVTVGAPLLDRPDDVERVAEALLADIPKERKPGETVILMGHGTRHQGNIYYPGIQYYFWKKDPNVFVGTVEGSPSIEDVLAGLKKKGIKKAYLMPLMSVAGDHARNDMAGDENDSWKSTLGKAGVVCVPVLKGMAEYDNVADVWIDHLKAAFASLK